MIAKLCGMIIGVQSGSKHACLSRVGYGPRSRFHQYIVLHHPHHVPQLSLPTEVEANKDSEKGTLSSSSQVRTTHALPILAYHVPSPTCRPRSISNIVAVCGLIRLRHAYAC